MTIVTRHALRVYAAISSLKSSRDGDVIDALIPFMEPVLELMSGKIFDPALLALGVQKLYGWRINRDIAENFTGRLLSKGYLKRQANNIFTVEFSPDKAGEDDQIEITQVLEKIIDEFESFPPRITDLFQFSLNREYLQDILVRFLVSFEAFDEQSFKDQVERMRLGLDTKTMLDQLTEGGRPLIREDQYLCARFVRQLVQEKPQFIPHLSRLASIALLTEVVDDFVKPTTDVAKSDLTIILDAPVALTFLGLSGREECRDISNVITSLRSIGCNVIVLPTSIDEMARNLQSMLSHPAPDRYGPTHDAMRKGEITEDFVRTVMRDPERALRNLGVVVRPVDLNTNPSQARFFDAAVYEDFFAGISWKPTSMDARQHDAICTTITMRLRSGVKSSDPLSSKFVFVTTNSIFVRYAREFCRRYHLINEYQTPPVITQRELAMTAWLRTGLNRDDAANVDIPRAHLIASCERVLRPRREVLKAVHDKLKEFAPDRIQQYELLLSDQRSVERLMDETLGDEKLVTAESAEKLLNEMRIATAAEIRNEYEEKVRNVAQRHRLEKKELQKANEAVAREADRAISEQKAEMLALQAEKDRLRNLAVDARRADIDRISGLMKRINSSIVWLDRGLAATAVLIAAIGLFGSLLESSSLRYTFLGISLLFSLIVAYQFIREVQQKPKYGIQNILEMYGRHFLSRGFKIMNLKTSLYEMEIEIRSGYLFWKEGAVERLMKIDT